MHDAGTVWKNESALGRWRLTSVAGSNPTDPERRALSDRPLPIDRGLPARGGAEKVEGGVEKGGREGRAGDANFAADLEPMSVPSARHRSWPTPRALRPVPLPSLSAYGLAPTGTWRGPGTRAMSGPV